MNRGLKNIKCWKCIKLCRFANLQEEINTIMPILDHKMKQRKDATEMVRNKLNKIPEKDTIGNNQRFQSQFVTWIVGGIVESAKDPNIRRFGKTLRKGAEKSFSDLAAQKITDRITKFFNDNSQYDRRL